MENNEIKELKDLVEGYCWNNEQLNVLVSGENLKQFVRIIQNSFCFENVQAFVDGEGNITFVDFQDILKDYDLNAHEIFKLYNWSRDEYFDF